MDGSISLFETMSHQYQISMFSIFATFCRIIYATCAVLTPELYLVNPALVANTDYTDSLYIL